MKVVFSDIDGTFKVNMETPEINIEAVKQLEDAGHRFVFVSGRGAKDIMPLLEETGIECDYIFGNGAGYRIMGEEPVLKHVVPKEDYAMWEELLHQPEVFYYMHVDTGIIMEPLDTLEPHFEILKEAYTKEYNAEIAENVTNRRDYYRENAIFSENPFQFLRENPEYHLIKFEVMNGEEEIRERLKKQALAAGYRAFNSMFMNLEIVPMDSNKGDGIRDYLELFPEVSKTYGFGDAENDLEMFGAVDVPIAAANSKKEILPYCDFELDTPIGEYIIDHIVKGEGK